jgi:hypothetical protein
MSGVTLFADVETGDNQMCGTYYVYWQAGGCAPIASNCHSTTIHAGYGASQAESHYNA